MKNLHGLGVALITPMDKTGEIDYTALGRLVLAHIKAGTDYLVVLGTTAETPTLSFAEKQKIVSHVVDVSQGRIPLVLGLGGNNTQALLEEFDQWDFSNFEAILSVTPFYNRPSQKGLIAHYTALADRSPKPVLLYNVPARTGVNMLPETVVALASHDNIVGIKEATSSTAQILDLIASVPEGFLVISGDDHLAPFLMHQGGVGCISVIGNAYPKPFQELLALSQTDPNFQQSPLYESFQPSIDLIFKEGNPTGIKALLEIFGYITPHLRLPLVEASTELKEQLAKTSQQSALEAL